MGRLSRSRPMASQPLSSSQKSRLKAAFRAGGPGPQFGRADRVALLGGEEGPGQVGAVGVTLHLS